MPKSTLPNGHTEKRSYLEEDATQQSSVSPSTEVKSFAVKLGFQLVGIAPAHPLEEATAYRQWIEQGYHGEMAYMARDPEKREDVRHHLPSARSVIMCGLNYFPGKEDSMQADDPSRGRVAKYARGEDYHELIREKLIALCQFLSMQFPPPVETKMFVDTTYILEKAFGRYAGLGWFGKNTCLINPKKGSCFFLGGILTNLQLAYDLPQPDRCGTCTRCLDACPTQAFDGPGRLDARKCIAYLTIELKETIPEALREKIGNWVYGCDVCQDVCPWNRKAEVTLEPTFTPRETLQSPNLKDLLPMTPQDFSVKFKGSPIKRSKWRGFMRNVLVAAGNSCDASLAPHIKPLTQHEDLLIREQAAWAFQQIRQDER